MDVMDPRDTEGKHQENPEVSATTTGRALLSSKICPCKDGTKGAPGVSDDFTVTTTGILSVPCGSKTLGPAGRVATDNSLRQLAHFFQPLNPLTSNPTRIDLPQCSLANNYHAMLWAVSAVWPFTTCVQSPRSFSAVFPGNQTTQSTPDWLIS
jgi:hypothetical protein